MVFFPTFAAWAASQGKNYNGDEVAREAIYNANVKWITANDEDGVMGPTQFMDMTPEDFRSEMLTLKPRTTPLETQAYLGRHEVSSSTNPTEIDWATQGAVSPIKNQGSCGSCWAFSTVGSLEGRAAIAQGVLPVLSEQQFVDCDVDFGDLGCKGGLMDSAFQYIMQSGGACTEDSYAYEGKATTCRTSACTVGLASSSVTGYMDVDATEQALEDAVSEGPVSVAVDAQTSFQFYFGGIVKNRLCGASLDHGVLAVGYGVDNGHKYWKVKNSWGAGWGEKGYIRLLKGKGGTGQCGILMGPPSYPVISASSVTV